MLPIRKNVPMPESTPRSGSNMNQLLAMEVGDSIFFDEPIKNKATRFYRVASKLGMKIRIAKEVDKKTGKSGLGLWVVEKGKAPTIKPPVEKKAAVAKKPAKKAAKKASPKKPAAKKKAAAKKVSVVVEKATAKAEASA